MRILTTAHTEWDDVYYTMIELEPEHAKGIIRHMDAVAELQQGDDNVYSLNVWDPSATWLGLEDANPPRSVGWLRLH